MKSKQLILIASCFVAVFGFGALRAHAQSYYDIEGVIETPNGTPTSGVAVFLEDVTRSRVGQTITSSDGRYRFSRIIAGTYYIVVKPNNNELRQAVRRIELLDAARVGSVVAAEHVDIVLEALPVLTDSVATVVFAQAIPPAAKVSYEKGMSALTKNKSQEAITNFTEALRLFPDYFLASQQLGLLYVEQEDYRQAIPFLVKAVEVNPKAGASYVALGISSLKLNRPDLALDALQRAVPFQEKSFRLHFYLGLTLLDLNRLDEAETSLKESYKLGGATKAASAHLYLASIYTKQEKTRQAITELENYLIDSPKASNAANVREAIARLKAKL